MLGKQEAKGDGNFQAGRDINVTSAERRLPSLLSSCLPLLVRVGLDEESANTEPYTIPGKIEYNELHATKEWVAEHGRFVNAIDAIYNSFDAEHPMARARIMRGFRNRYQTRLTDYWQDALDRPRLEVVRANADRLLSSIVQDVARELRESGVHGAYSEDVGYVAMSVVVHAFISCQILERPPE